MTRIRILLLAAVALAAYLSAQAAFALPTCTHHDRLVQKINEAYQTQFPTNCTVPLDKPIREVD